MMQKTKGISLIVLVITIIVMIILAGSIILTLSNNGIIEQAQQAVKVTNINQVKTLAELKWAEAYNKHGADLTKLKFAVFNGLHEAKIKPSDYDRYIISVTETGVGVLSKDEVLNIKNTIPEGGTYYVGVTSTQLGDYTGYTQKLEKGDEFPAISSPGDVYVYGDYEYRYNFTYGMYDDGTGGVWSEYSQTTEVRLGSESAR